MDAQGILVMVF